MCAHAACALLQYVPPWLWAGMSHPASITISESGTHERRGIIDQLFRLPPPGPPCVVTQINKTLKVPSVEIQFTHQGGGTESGNMGASPLKAQPPQARADQTLYQCCKSIPECRSETFLSAPTVAHPPNAVVMNAEVAGGSVFEQREARALIGNSH